MAHGTVMPAPKYTAYDNDGDPLAGGRLYVYAAGTTTLVSTFSDVDLQIPNPNPIVLDAGGRATVFLAPGAYKFVQKTSADVIVWTQDNVLSTLPYEVDLDIEGVAGEGILSGQVCYLGIGAGGLQAGRWYLADADLVYASSGAEVIGVAQGDIVAGASGTFRIQGRVVVPGPLTVGLNYYVSTVAGGLVNPAPVNSRLVGIADSTMTLLMGTGFGARVIIGNVNIEGDLHVTGDLVVEGDFVLENLILTGGLTIEGPITNPSGPVFIDDSLVVTGPISNTTGPVLIDDDLTVTGDTIIDGSISNSTGPVLIDDDLHVTGDTTMDGSLTVVGPITGSDAHFTGSLTVDGPTTFNGGLAITNGGLDICDHIQFTCGPENWIYENTADGADDRRLVIAAGGAITQARGALITLTGNEYPLTTPGSIQLGLGDGPGSFIGFYTPLPQLMGAMWRSGGLTWGPGALDPGLSNVAIAGNLLMSGGMPHVIALDTPDGNDTGALFLSGGGTGGGGVDHQKGAIILLYGNEAAVNVGGQIVIAAGGTITSNITFGIGQQQAGMITTLRGLWWGQGPFVDPGPGSVIIENKLTVGLQIVVGPALIVPGSGSPEGIVVASVGSLYLRTDGTTGTTLYVKETGGSTATGWAPAGGGGGGMPAAHASTHYVGGSDPITGALSITTLTASGDIVTDAVVSALAVAASVTIQSPEAVFTTLTSSTGQFNTSVTSALGSFGSLGATPLNASNINSGTVPDTHLSVNVLKHAGGYPGGTTNFLRADGTFAAPAGGGGTPAAHHLTHEVGGSDQITGAMAFQSLVTTADITVGGEVLFAPDPMGTIHVIGVNTTPGADTNALTLMAGSPTSPGPYVQLAGNNLIPFGGFIQLQAGDVPGGDIYFQTGPSGTVRGKMFRSGGFSWGGANTDPGAGNLSVGGNITLANDVMFTGTSASLTLTTADGLDNGFLALSGGGGFNTGRGAYLVCYGNEQPAYTGSLFLYTGDAPTARILFHVGADVNPRGAMHPSGGFSWGSTIDPGAGNLSVANKLVLTHTGGYPGGTTTFLRADGTFATPAGGGGSGDVAGPASATDGNFAVFSGTTGKIIKESPLVKIFTNGSISVGSLTDGGAAGRLTLHGNAASGSWIDLMTGVGLRAMRAHHSSGISIGDATDPGAGNLRIAGSVDMPQAVASIRMVSSNQQQQFGTTSLGAMLTVFGNTRGATPGNVLLQTGTVAGAAMEFTTGTTPTVRQRIHASGGVSFGDLVDPGVGNVSVAGKLVLTHTGGYPGGTTTFLRADGTFAAAGGGAVTAHASTHYVGGSDPITGALNLSALTLANGVLLMDATNNFIGTTGATNRTVSLCGGTSPSNTTGAYVTASGNAAAIEAGTLYLVAGNVATGAITFQTGNILHGKMHASGGFSWGNTTDPGVGKMSVGAANALVLTHPGGYPGGTTTFLRADGTFATAGGGGVALHAATHSIGGTDPLVNAAWTNNENVFTLRQWVAMSQPQVVFYDSAQGVDLKAFDLINTGQKLSFRAINDAATVLQTTPLTLSRNGDATFGRDAVIGGLVRKGTVDAADTSSLVLCGGGGGPVSFVNERGATITLGGNEEATLLGDIEFQAGNGTNGRITFRTPTGGMSGRFHKSGCLAWGGNLLDAGANTVSLDTSIIYGGAPLGKGIRFIDDTGAISITGGGDLVNPPGSHGAMISLHGNSANPLFGTPPGQLLLAAGDVAATGNILFSTGAVERGRMYRTGGFSWGGTVDPGAGNLNVAGEIQVGVPGAAGNVIVRPGTSFGADTKGLFLQAGQFGFSGGQIAIVGNEYGGPLSNSVAFYTGGMQRGQMYASGGFGWGAVPDPGSQNIGAAAFATGSDTRIKRDLGVWTDTIGLKSLVVHEFKYLRDDRYGRGVFAQQANDHIPHAVIPGLDDLDDEGQLKQPWGVDYTKLVPDLIVGWQQHEKTIEAHEKTIEALFKRITKLEGKKK